MFYLFLGFSLWDAYFLQLNNSSSYLDPPAELHRLPENFLSEFLSYLKLLCFFQWFASQGLRNIWNSLRLLLSCQLFYIGLRIFECWNNCLSFLMVTLSAITLKKHFPATCCLFFRLPVSFLPFYTPAIYLPTTLFQVISSIQSPYLHSWSNFNLSRKFPLISSWAMILLSKFPLTWLQISFDNSYFSLLEALPSFSSAFT